MSQYKPRFLGGSLQYREKQYGPRFLGGTDSFAPSSSPYGATLLGLQGNFLNTFRVTDMQNMGIRWLRFFINWQYIEATQTCPNPTYDWSEPDAAIAMCNAAGINYDFCIAIPAPWHCYGYQFDPSFPCYPTLPNNPCDPSKTDWAFPADAAAFATAVATRYDGNHGHGHIEAIEIANEGYDDGKSQCQDGKYAVAVSQAIYQAVKAVNPNILVGAPAQLHVEKVHFKQWITDFYASGGGPFCDYHQIHHYPGERGPNVDDGIHYTLYDAANTVKQVAADPKLPGGPFHPQVWITETGYAQNNLHGTSGTTCAPLCGYEQQACLLQETLDAGRLSGGIIDKVFLYTLAGDDGYSPVSGQMNETFHCGYYLYAGGSRTYECHPPGTCSYPVGYTTLYPVWTGGVSQPTLSVSPGALNFSGTQGQPDPSSQTIMLSDTSVTGTAWTSAITYISGSGWLSLFPTSGTLAGNGSVSIAISATVGALSPGTYSGSITFTAVTGGATATVYISLIVTGIPSGPSSIVAQDSFTRANQSGWGTASDGSDTWVQVVGTAALSIALNKGVLATSTNPALIALGTGMLINGDVTVRFVSTHNTSQAGLLVRYQNSSNFVRCEVFNGTLRFRKNLAGVLSFLSPTASPAILANTAYWIHVNVSGSSYNVNVWADGSPEPGGWMLSCSDSSFTGVAGQYGIFGDLSNSTDTLSYDQFLATTTFSTYYVAPSGSDSNPGTSASPWKTLSKVKTAIQAGDNIYVGDGTYSGQVALTTSGTAFAPIILKAIDRWKATIIETATHGIGSYDLSVPGDYITIDGFEVTGPDVQYGLLLASNLSFAQNCLVHDICQSFDPGTAGGGGIVNTVSGFAVSGATIRNNRVERIGPTSANSNIHGIDVQTSNPNGIGEVYNNLVLNASGYGIAMSHNPNNWVVTNNTIIHCQTGGMACNGDVGSGYLADTNTLQNNILYANGSGTSFPAIWSASDNCGTHNVFRNNLAWYPGSVITVTSYIPRSFGGTIILSQVVSTAIYDFTPANIHPLQTGTNLPNADPQFVTYHSDGSGDYHLSASGSPAIDSGFALLSPSTDFDYRVRPQGGGYDVGAYEALAPLTMTTGGKGVFFDEDTFHLSEKLDERQRFQVSVLDYAGNRFHPYSERVVVTDPVLGKLFSGFVVDVKQDKSNTMTSASMEHQLDCVDNRHLAGKRTSNLVYTMPTYAGKIVADMLEQTLSAEGVIAYYATHTDRRENDFALGTLSSVVATNNAGGDLELLGTSVGAFYFSQSSWNTGTFSHIQANPGGDLSLVGATRNWDDGDFSNQTLYGLGHPTQSVQNGVLVMTSGPNSEARSRLDFAGAIWANGAGGKSATIACDFSMGGFTPYNSFSYRTTSWNNNNGSFAYAVEANLQHLYLKKGTNGGSGPVTTVASYTFSPPLSPGWYRIQVVVSSSNVHTISVNGTTRITVTDNSYTAPGYIALRELNLESYALVQYFDNFGVMESLTGTWTSATTSLASVPLIASSVVTWDTSLSQGGTITVQSSLNGGSTWSTCSNGATIPGLDKGSSGTGKSLLLKISLSTTTTAQMPDIQALQWNVTGAYASSGTRTSIASDITYATDTFTRANQSGWGTASDLVDVWSFDAGAGTLAIASNEGTVTGAGTFNYMRLGTTVVGDASASVRTALGDAGDENAILLRYSNPANHYRAYLGNSNQLVMERKVKNVKSTLAAVPFPMTVGSFYWLRFQAQGSTLSARAWASGSPEPAGWLLSLTDTSFTNGNFGLMSFPNAASAVKFDQFTVASSGSGPSVDLTPVGQLGASFVSWTANVPTSTSLGVDISLDGGVTWTDVTGQNGGPIPGLNGQPEPVTDAFSSDTSANYTSTAATGGNTPLTLYGTNIVSSTLASAGQLSPAAGGMELSTQTKIGSATGYGELTALGTTSPWPALAGPIDSIPASGKGWFFDAPILEGQTIPAGPWQMTLTLRGGSTSGQALVMDCYVVISRYDSVALTYTTLGTGSLLAQNVGSNNKVTLSFPTLSLSAKKFMTGQKLTIGVWPNVTTNGMGTGANLFAYEGNGNGVPADMQLVTPGFAPTGNFGTAAWTYDTAQSRLIATGGNQAIYSLNAPVVPNIDLLTDMDQSDSGGLCWNFIDGNNFYACQVADNQSSIGPVNTLTLYRTAGGITMQVGIAAVSFVRGTYHRLRATTNNGTITLRFDGDPVLIYTDGVPLSAGTYGLYTNGGTARFYQLWTQPLGDDVTGITVDSRLRLATADISLTPQVLSLTVAAFGPQIDIGALIPSVAYQYTFCDKNLDDLAKKSNYSTWIDQNNVLYFNHRQGLPAPWIAQSNNLGLPSDVELDSNLQVEVAGDVYRNRQVLTGVTNVGPFTDPFVGDGTATSFTLRYPVVATTIIPTITLNGNVQKVGLKGTTGSQWYYAVGDATIAQDTGGTALISADTLLVTYIGSFIDTVVVNNVPAQVALQQVEGGTGIVEAVQDVSSPGMLYDAAVVFANALLSRYCVVDPVTNLPTGRTITYKTYRDGLQVGMIQSHFIPEENLFDVQLLITQIDIYLKTQPNNTRLYGYIVQASELPRIASWGKLLADGLLQA